MLIPLVLHILYRLHIKSRNTSRRNERCDDCCYSQTSSCSRLSNLITDSLHVSSKLILYPFFWIFVISPHAEMFTITLPKLSSAMSANALCTRSMFSRWYLVSVIWHTTCQVVLKRYFFIINYPKFVSGTTVKLLFYFVTLYEVYIFYRLHIRKVTPLV